MKGTNVFLRGKWGRRIIDKASLVSAVKNHFIMILLALCFLGGMVLGAILARSIDQAFLSKIDFLFVSNFQERAVQPAFSVFTASFASSFLFLFACFLCGLSIWGAFMVPVILFFRGIGLGMTSGYLYALYGFHGVIFDFLVILPGAFLCCLALLLAAKESMRLSRNITGSGGLNIKMYFFRFGKVLMICFLAAVLDLLTTVCFAGLFSF